MSSSKSRRSRLGGLGRVFESQVELGCVLEGQEVWGLVSAWKRHGSEALLPRLLGCSTVAMHSLLSVLVDGMPGLSDEFGDLLFLVLGLLQTSQVLLSHWTHQPLVLLQLPPQSLIQSSLVLPDVLEREGGRQSFFFVVELHHRVRLVSLDVSVDLVVGRPEDHWVEHLLLRCVIVLSQVDLVGDVLENPKRPPHHVLARRVHTRGRQIRDSHGLTVSGSEVSMGGCQVVGANRPLLLLGETLLQERVVPLSIFDLLLDLPRECIVWLV